MATEKRGGQQQYTNPSDFPRGSESHSLSVHAAPDPVGHATSDKPHEVGRSPLEHIARSRTAAGKPEPDSLRQYQRKLAPKK